VATAGLVSRFSGVGVGFNLARLEDAVVLGNLGRGTQLFVPGHGCDRIYLLNSGRVKISTTGSGGKSCLFHLVEPGEIFGEAGLLGETVRTAAAEVLEPASVTMVPVRSVLAHAQVHPDFWLWLAPLLRKRIRSLEEQLQWVSFLEVEERLARLLLRWAESEDLDESNCSSAELRLSQRDMAGLIGATRETTSSALNRLQRSGAINIRRRCVTVESIAALRAAAGDLPAAKPAPEAEASPTLVRVHKAGGKR